MNRVEIEEKIAKAKLNTLMPEALKAKYVADQEKKLADLPKEPSAAEPKVEKKATTKAPAKPKKKKHEVVIKRGDKTVTPDDKDFCKEAEKSWYERRAKAKASHRKAKTTPVFTRITGEVADSVLKAVKSISVAEIKKDPKEFAKDAHKLESAAKEFLHSFKTILGSDYKAGEIEKEFSELEKVINAIVEKHKKSMAMGGKVSNQATEMIDGYKSAILFAENDLDDEPLDRNYSIDDFASETNERISKMIHKFIANNKESIEKSGLNYDTIGNDIWYTQKGHGVGFFDHNLDKDVEDKLKKSAKELGEFADIEVGGDGKLHILSSKMVSGGKISRRELLKRKKVGKVMHEFKEGELETSTGKTVTDRKQAIAIAMSESGLSKKN